MTPPAYWTATSNDMDVILEGQPSEQAKDIRKACMLNICSCHLNLGQLDSCAKECTEVLSIDASNRKALYRRGQAYSGLSRYTTCQSVVCCFVACMPAGPGVQGRCLTTITSSSHKIANLSCALLCLACVNTSGKVMLT